MEPSCSLSLEPSFGVLGLLSSKSLWKVRMNWQPWHSQSQRHPSGPDSQRFQCNRNARTVCPTRNLTMHHLMQPRSLWMERFTYIIFVCICPGMLHTPWWMNSDKPCCCWRPVQRGAPDLQAGCYVKCIGMCRFLAYCPQDADSRKLSRDMTTDLCGAPWCSAVLSEKGRKKVSQWSIAFVLEKREGTRVQPTAIAGFPGGKDTAEARQAHPGLVWRSVAGIYLEDIVSNRGAIAELRNDPSHMCLFATYARELRTWLILWLMLREETNLNQLLLVSSFWRKNRKQRKLTLASTQGDKVMFPPQPHQGKVAPPFFLPAPRQLTSTRRWEFCLPHTPTIKTHKARSGSLPQRRPFCPSWEDRPRAQVSQQRWGVTPAQENRPGEQAEADRDNHGFLFPFLKL